MRCTGQRENCLGGRDEPSPLREDVLDVDRRSVAAAGDHLGEASDAYIGLTEAGHTTGTCGVGDREVDDRDAGGDTGSSSDFERMAFLMFTSCWLR